MDLTGAHDLVIPALPPKAGESALTEVAVSVNRGASHTSHGLPPVRNGFLTWLNAVEDKKVGDLARAFHLATQLAGCDVPNFSHDSLRRQRERLRASVPLKPAVPQAVAHFVKAHPQVTPPPPSRPSAKARRYC